MNIFRLAADFTHLFAFLYLIHRILTKKSCYAISAKTQILYAMVFITRYLDLFFIFVSLYNCSFKVGCFCKDKSKNLILDHFHHAEHVYSLFDIYQIQRNL